MILHGGWLPADGTSDGRFVVWAESWRSGALPARRGPTPRVTADRARRHPFAASAADLRDALATTWPAAVSAEAGNREVIVRLPSIGGRPAPSPELPLAVTGSEPPVLGAWQVEALTLGPAEAVRLLLALAGAEADETSAPTDAAVRQRRGADLAHWTLAGRIALETLSRQSFVPTVEPSLGPTDTGALQARWRPDFAGDVARGLAALASAQPPAARAVAWTVRGPEPKPRELLADFLGAAVDALAREWARAGAPARDRRLSAVVAPWLAALTGDPTIAGPARVVAALRDGYRDWTAASVAASAESFRVAFRLSPPESADGEPPDSSDSWSLDFLLQAADEPSLLVPAADVWKTRGETARFLDRRFDAPQERFLAGLGRAARLAPAIERGLDVARPEGLSLATADVPAFLREQALLLQAAGFGVLVPGLQTQLRARLRLRGKSSAPTDGQAGALTFEKMVGFDWELALGDETLSPEEFAALARLKQPLVSVRGRWVLLDPEQLARALDEGERHGQGDLGLSDALRLALDPSEVAGVAVDEVRAEGWLADLIETLRAGGGREELAEPAGFVGALRPYQRVGVSWLATLRRFGLGGCLADDMGLGKTPQTIALLLHQRAAGDGGPTLLVCPTSLVGNWSREIARFAPGLRVLVHYGAQRERAEFAALAAAHDVVISTYALLPRDEAELASVEWANVVLDEAQNIKNPATKAARAAAALRSRWRLALTGTPVENRLTELWSIFRFANPGYLGSLEAFRRSIALPIERARDAAATARLRRLVAPFILRRLKSDRSIIDDLPAKNEMKVYCTLTREQATLYQATLRESLRQVEESAGIERRGLVLAMLTRLKQICDHPALFLHDGSELGGRSGKLARLEEMLEEVLAVGERALVFTQYAEMGKLLAERLERAFGREVLFLHGGTPGADRDAMVARFQAAGHAPPLFVLSLKAGGTGLNLTRANHVFHFDRWWNPAVENQATDRAYRIGQEKNVEVHKFVCAGTFEEALDALIERKVELAEAVVGAGESWLTELGDAELRELLALRPDAVGEE